MCMPDWVVSATLFVLTMFARMKPFSSQTCTSISISQLVMHYWPFKKGIHQSSVASLHKEPVIHSFGCFSIVGLDKLFEQSEKLPKWDFLALSHVKSQKCLVYSMQWFVKIVICESSWVIMLAPDDLGWCAVWLKSDLKPRSHRIPRLNHVQKVMKIWWTWS